MNPLLSTAYWPNLHYFFYVFNAGTIHIEQHEHYQKQSYRNRMQLLTANGPMDLVIPVHKKNEKEFIKDIEISYLENWQPRHWKTITSAYKNSPYFEFFEDDIRLFYEQRFEKLLDYNTEQLKTVLKLLKLKKEIRLSTCFEKKPLDLHDLRELIHPKKDFRDDTKVTPTLVKNYYQTFGGKFEFIPNLSILDLLFNQATGAVEYLRANG